ncbi:MAG: cupredoxin domain-containing protein [Planctomycetes bacterium]|nr:cupredoxin domain-containing protein [Planctomycetota bacterium]
MRTKWVVATGIGILFVAGCETGSYVTDSASRVKAADWKTMQTVDVVLKEYSYTPDTLKFKAGTPYKLQILNRGENNHYFVAQEFFKAIATRKVQSNADGEIKAPYFSALEIFPGRSLDLYFVPVKKGIYSLHCTNNGHEEKGMHGAIVIE